MNKIILMGNTTKDIELRKTNSGKSVAAFSLAVKRPFTQDTTDFFNCVAWERTAETLSDYVKKGTKILVEGYLTNREYEKDGAKRIITEVIVERFHFCESKGGGKPQAKPSAEDYSIIADDEDLPF